MRAYKIGLSWLTHIEKMSQLGKRKGTQSWIVLGTMWPVLMMEWLIWPPNQYDEEQVCQNTQWGAGLSKYTVTSPMDKQLATDDQSPGSAISGKKCMRLIVSIIYYMVDSRFSPSQWKTPSLCNGMNAKQLPNMNLIKAVFVNDLIIIYTSFMARHLRPILLTWINLNVNLDE